MATVLILRYGPRSWVEVHPVVLGEQLSQDAAREALSALRSEGFLFTRKAPALAAALAAEAGAGAGVATESGGSRHRPPSLLFPSEWGSAGECWLVPYSLSMLRRPDRPHMPRHAAPCAPPERKERLQRVVLCAWQSLVPIAGGGMLRLLGEKGSWKSICRGWQWAVHQSPVSQD